MRIHHQIHHLQNGIVLEMGMHHLLNLIHQNYSMQVSNGESTSFWKDAWLSNLTLQTQFPAVFEVCDSKEITVVCARTFVNDVVSWDLGIHRRVHDQVVEELTELIFLLENYTKRDLDSEDHRVWKGNKANGVFSVKDCYEWLCVNTPRP